MRLFTLGLLALAALVTLPRPVSAQLNAAYANGYKPMLDMSSKLNDLAGSADKREDYGFVKDVGAAYVEKLNYMVTALETAGKACTDSSNRSFAASSCSPALAAAKTAKDKAEKLRDKGDRKESCKNEVQALQESLATLSDATKRCWSEHEEYLTKVQDTYIRARASFVDKAQDLGKPLEEVGKKLTDAKNRADAAKAKAAEMGAIFKAALEQDNKARADLFKNEKAPAAEQKKTFEIWMKSDEVLYKATNALSEADRAARDADQAYSDAYKEFQKACDEFKVKEDQATKDFREVVLGLLEKVEEMEREYRRFSW